MKRRSWRDISDKEAADFTRNCKLRYEWSSDPKDPCNECEYKQVCKGKFYRRNPAYFDYDLEAMKRTIFRKYMAENVSGDMPLPEEQLGDEEKTTYI